MNLKALLLKILVGILLSSSVSAEPIADGLDAEQLAVINSPRGIVRSGNDIIVLTYHGSLIRVTPEGAQETMLTLPAGIWIGPAIDLSTGDLYVSQYGGIGKDHVYRVRGNEVEQIAYVYNPAGLQISASGSTLFVSSYRGNSVKAIDLQTREVSDCATSIPYPDGIEVVDDHLIVASRSSHALLKVSPNCGTVTTLAQRSGINNPIDVSSIG